MMKFQRKYIDIQLQQKEEDFKRAAVNRLEWTIESTKE